MWTFIEHYFCTTVGVRLERVLQQFYNLLLSNDVRRYYP